MVMFRDQNAEIIHNIFTENRSLKGRKSRIYEKNVNKSKFCLGRSWDKIEVRECLLSLGAESFVIQFVIQKCEDKDTQNHNFVYYLCVCETWMLTLREERRMRVFENRFLRRLFVLKKEEETGEWRNLKKKSSLIICTPHQTWLGDKVEKNEMSAACSTYWEGRVAYRVLLGKH